MRRLLQLASFAIGVSAFAAGPRVTIVLGEGAPVLEKRAAQQIAEDLQEPGEAPPVIQAAPPADTAPVILVGSPATNPAIPGSAWPRLSEQGHILRSTPRGLIVGGSTPAATLWAASELGYRLGIRHLVHGQARPVEKPPLRLEGLDVVLEPAVRVRAWSGFGDLPHSAASWPLAEHRRLIAQLARLKFTHILLPAKLTPFAAISVGGDLGGRAAFKGAKAFQPPEEKDLLREIGALAAEHGLAVVREAPPGVRPLALGAAGPSVLPQFALRRLAADFQSLTAAGAPGFVATAVMPGDLNPAIHFLSRASFDPGIAPEQALSDLVTPICGEGVASRLWKGFEQIEKAADLIGSNDPLLGVPNRDMLLRHLNSSASPPAWLGEVKALYIGAMNEMYRGNTRARGGARPFILYHAKRLEFAMQYCSAVEAAGKAGLAKAGGNEAARAEALEQAVEAIYNGLNAHGEVARDASDRGVIALVNEHGYRPVLRALEGH